MRTEGKEEKERTEGKAAGWAKAGAVGGGKGGGIGRTCKGTWRRPFFLHPNGRAFGMTSLCIFKMDVGYRSVAIFALVVTELDCLLNRNT